MDDAASHLRVTGIAQLGFVDQILDDLEGLYRRAGEVSDEDRAMFSLAVSEIVTNMITHGQCADDAEITLTAEMSIDDAELTARFQDDAAPVSVPLAEAELPDELAESGRGLAIAKMALDQLSHEVGDGHTWTLVRKRH